MLKLACLYDLFELPDCAAELLISRGGFLPSDERERLLDLLVSGRPGSYAEHMALFEQDYKAFYPSRLKAAAEPVSIASPENVDGTNTVKRVRHLRKRLVTLRKKNASLRERLRARDKQIEELTRQADRNRR